VDGVGVSSALLAACKHPCGSETVQCDDLHVCVFFLSFPLNDEGCRACKLLGQHWGSWWGWKSWVYVCLDVVGWMIAKDRRIGIVIDVSFGRKDAVCGG
jgi:hypothetical protein